MNESRQWEPIPGETPIDPSGLKIHGVRTRRELDIVEAENIRKATTKYLQGRLNRRTAPFDFGWAFRLHEEMFGDVWKWAGRQRESRLNIGCQPHQIAEQLGHLLGDLRSWSACDTPIHEQAAMLHHRAVMVHPFEKNGNGRWSRLLANIWLHLAGAAWIEWPSETIGKESEIRSTYLAALKEADSGNDTALLSIQSRFILPMTT